MLGAQKKGLLTAIESRKGRGEEIARAYGQIFAQATAFGHRFWKKMTPEQKSTLRAFLALPYQSPAGRKEYHASPFLQEFPGSDTCDVCDDPEDGGDSSA